MRVNEGENRLTKVFGGTGGIKGKRGGVTKESVNSRGNASDLTPGEKGWEGFKQR